MFAIVLFCFAITVVGAKNIQLSSSDVLWTFRNGNGSISGNATVPGGIYSDLQNAGIIDDILFGFNDVLTRWVAYDTWTYGVQFNVPEEQLNSRVCQLVFEGLDTVAFVELNEVPIGTSDNMFVRYTYDVKNQIRAGQNTLKITFVSPVQAAHLRSINHFAAPKCVPDEYNGECHANQLRKMQASFGWDWGPAFPSVGIWKPVYIQMYDSAIITGLTTHTIKDGAQWNLTARVFLETSLKVSQIKGLLIVTLNMEGKQVITKWQDFNNTTNADGTAEVDVDLSLSENAIRLWWPNGYGAQVLYDLSVQLRIDGNSQVVSQKNVKIGFRTIEVVEEDASSVLGNKTDAGRGLTFYFKVNNYPIFMKGSNWIPANVLPELGSQTRVGSLLIPLQKKHGGEINKLCEGGLDCHIRDEFFLVRSYPNLGKIVNLLEQGPGSTVDVADISITLDNARSHTARQTAAKLEDLQFGPNINIVLYTLVDKLLGAAQDAHMGMLRVWGGGVYESDYFYEKCDQLGLLIWQDFLFACSMYPVDKKFIESVKTEIEQNVIRLQHHPSIAVWAGNNENEVALRGNWYGTQSEFQKIKDEYIKLYVDTIKPIVEDLDPDRRYLVSSPSNGLESEKEGYIALNPYDAHYGDTHYYNYLANNWDMNIYPKTRFASEYGFQSMPSITTMKTATNNSEDFDVNSAYSNHRQHSPKGYLYITDQMLANMKLEPDDPKYFEKYVFYSQILQAMAIKTESEFYRQSQQDWYTMGALYWQLNDVWQAPSWSGIEYGGKLKMLHYFAKSFFAPVLVSPRLLLTGDVQVYLINDRLVPISESEIVVQLFYWDSLTPNKTKTYTVGVGPLSSNLLNIQTNIWKSHGQEKVFLKFTLNAPDVKTSPCNYVFPKPLKSIVGLKEPNIQIFVSNIVIRKLDRKLEYSINIMTDTVILFLWLETDIDGYFENNGIIVTEKKTKMTFICESYIAPSKLQRSFKTQYYIH